MTKNELKHIVKMALETEYRFESRNFSIGQGSNRINTVWCGKGTIERV